MILDWDIHHGNGTQKSFYQDDQVLYVSLHRFEMGKYYPGTIQGQYDQTGEGKGEGFNCNITWPVGGVGDAEYMWAFEQVVMPMGREFKPDLVIISSGGASDELPDPLSDPKPEVIEIIDKVIRLQSKYWNCFRRRHANSGCNFNEPINDSIISKNFPLQKAIRQQQQHYLSDEFNFVTLPLVSMDLPDNTVLCTPNISESNTIIIVVHDTSDIWAKRNVISGTIDLSSSVIIDNSLDFIKWGLDRTYGIIDVNIPLTLFEPDNYSGMITSQEVLIYLWDNYIKYFPSVAKIAFIGIGDSYSGIVHLLGHRDTRAVTKTVINFLGDKQLKPLVPLVDETLSEWYFKNSLIFSNNSHQCWKENESRKPRKKFGRVLRCDTDGLNNIIEERFEEATDFILDSFEEWSDEE
ncbi:AIF_HP2_G0044770.mRNA.1.CDS.1 [Saccharomyces cerevisiae]|nr:AIF_HP2_G0044770.mRNA.1.CDS.1 [Saccharomyces cerevisiae]CAI6728616.1 AIF_HP2_G0044770.mRNA.1.CDS.1 [Saccharomyces cerevisiae]